MAKPKHARSPGWIMILVFASPILGMMAYDVLRVFGVSVPVALVVGITVGFSLLPAIMISAILHPSEPLAARARERCPECDTDLSGLNASFCPYCGRPQPKPAPDPFGEGGRCADARETRTAESEQAE